MGMLCVLMGLYEILYQLHAMELKLNRLLDNQGISVTDWDIAKD
jgi:hypothetical protein